MTSSVSGSNYNEILRSILSGVLNAVAPSTSASGMRHLRRTPNRYREPLGRKEGQPLDPSRWTEAELAQIKRDSGPRTWSALWQQTPYTEGGGLLARSVFESKERESKRILTPTEFAARTQNLRWCRFYDFAYTARQYNKPDPDFTVGTRMAFHIDPWGQFFDIFIWDQVRYRENWGRVKELVRQQAEWDGSRCWIGAESNGPQKMALQDLSLDPALRDFVFVGIPVLDEPSARAQLWTSRAQEGRMYLCKGDWTKAFLDEIEAFPNGGHDDTIDSVSGAYVMCSLRASNYERDEAGQGQQEYAPVVLNKKWGT